MVNVLCHDVLASFFPVTPLALPIRCILHRLATHSEVMEVLDNVNVHSDVNVLVLALVKLLAMVNKDFFGNSPILASIWIDFVALQSNFLCASTHRWHIYCIIQALHLLNLKYVDPLNELAFLRGKMMEGVVNS